MAKLSVSLDDDLAAELRRAAPENVSAFVADALRDALDRQRLLEALAELDDEFGVLDDGLITEAEALFDAVERANAGTAAAPSDPTLGAGAKKAAKKPAKRMRAGAR